MLDFIYKRHSIRKFKDKDVPINDIKEMIKAATFAPSGKNKQNWHFVVVKNKNKLNKIAEIIENKAKKLAENVTDETKKKKFLSQLNFHTFFKEAPVTIFVFVGPYHMGGLEIFKESNPSSEEIHEYMQCSPKIQNIGACMENLLLAAANLGYGGCWMTGPMYAKNEIEEYLKLNKKGYSLACLTPIGVPENSNSKNPPRKPLNEVMTIIE